jgi:ATP-binding cassette, subfamily A (ABC1), member 3
MIAGILKPTSGKVTIFGENLVEDINEVRKSLGYCQQFDVLHDILTVKEHLEIVCALKDVPKNEIDKAV